MLWVNVALWLFNMYLCGYMAMGLCGYVAVWLSGYVAQLSMLIE